MAVMHASYTFDAVHFHHELASKVIKHDRLQLDELYSIAAYTVTNSTTFAHDLRILLRFNDDWLDRSDDNSSHLHQLYMLALTSYLTPGVSLTKAHSSTIWLVATVLSLLGWSQEDIAILTKGNPLHTLVAYARNPLFTSAFAAGLDQYGGWIELEYVRHFYKMFEEIKRDFIAHRTATMFFNTYPEYASYIFQPTIIAAYENTLSMLKFAVIQKRSLYIIID